MVARPLRGEAAKFAPLNLRFPDQAVASCRVEDSRSTGLFHGDQATQCPQLLKSSILIRVTLIAESKYSRQCPQLLKSSILVRVTLSAESKIQSSKSFTSPACRIYYSRSPHVSRRSNFQNFVSGPLKKRRRAFKSLIILWQLFLNWSPSDLRGVASPFSLLGRGV